MEKIIASKLSAEQIELIYEITNSINYSRICGLEERISLLKSNGEDHLNYLDILTLL